MNVDSRFSMSQGEWFAAGFFEVPDGSPVVRMARAVRRQLENCLLPVVKPGSPLYPSGPTTIYATRHNVFTFNYSYSATCQYALQERIDQASTAQEREQWQAMARAVDAYPLGTKISGRYALGGNGYTHSIPNSGRVLAEGLDGYARRVAKGKADIARRSPMSTDKVSFYQGLEDVLAGARVLHARVVARIEELSASDPMRQLLLEAYRVVPFAPARTFFEAMVAVNFIFYLDGCDSLGHLDRVLGEYYRRDLLGGEITHQRAVELVRSLWRSFDENSAWNVAIGGSGADGSPAYSEFTLVCLEAAKGMRRPNLALKVRPDMPPDHWQATLDCLQSGCGQPALYNDSLYLRALRGSSCGTGILPVSECAAGILPASETYSEDMGKMPMLRTEDLCNYAFGGCTETMIHGRSNVGSLDAGINLLEILLETLRESLEGSRDFEELLGAYRDKLRKEIAEMAEQVNRDQETRARYRPQMVRSLLVDDCIDAGREFNAGGARYNWSVVNVGGLANVADSLAAIRELVYGEDTAKKHGQDAHATRGQDVRETHGQDARATHGQDAHATVSAAEYLRAIERDFSQDAPLLADIRRCPRFGNDQDSVDLLAREVADIVFGEISRHACWRGGRFLPGCLLFATYAWAGSQLTASPDGRRAGQAIADSIGPHQGRDLRGPTAMLKSVAKLDHAAGLGTLVLNLRLSKSFFASSAGRRAIIDLVQGYFNLGGMQLQVSVIDQEVMRDAIAHPERHGNLIVRIGGYSEYFNNLSPELKQTVLERTEHAGR